MPTGYRVTTYAALQANLPAAGTTVGLCRASLGRLPLSEERAETIERLRKQMGDLDAMILELNRPGESWASGCQDAPPENARATPQRYPVRRLVPACTSPLTAPDGPIAFARPRRHGLASIGGCFSPACSKAGIPTAACRGACRPC